MANTENKKRILVTGGSGLVGQGIKLAIEKESVDFQEEWKFLSSKDADLRDQKETFDVIEKFSPTHVIHLAAKVGGLFKNMNFQLEMFTDNMKINQNVLEACSRLNVKKCISCLSTCIFPDKTTYPIDESMIHLGPPHDSNFGYAYAKRNIDILNRCYNEQNKCLFTSIIPCNVFGPHDNYHLQDAHVIPALIHRIYLSKKNDQQMKVLGTGNPLRQFIYSEDLGRMILLLLREYTSSDPVILCTPKSSEYSIKHAASVIAKCLKYDKELVFDSSFADGQYKKTASVEKFLKLFPDFKFTQFEEAIQRSVDWFVSNYEVSRK